MIINERNLDEFLNSYLKNVSGSFLELYSNNTFFKVIDTLGNCWKSHCTVHLAGNGGSAAMVSHFATDWTKGLFINT
jgi:phosphoheptose isomerase